MPTLSDDEYDRTFGAPMQRLPLDLEPPFDFWPYVNSIPTEDFGGFDCSGGAVEFVYRHPEERFEHVLINSDDRDVFMVIVIDRLERRVVGHRLLNLARMYGLTG